MKDFEFFSFSILDESQGTNMQNQTISAEPPLRRTMSTVSESRETPTPRKIPLNTDINALELFTKPSNKYVVTSLSSMLMSPDGQALETFLQSQNIVQVKFLKELFFDLTRPERASKVTHKQKIILCQAVVFGFPGSDLVRLLTQGKTTLSEDAIYDFQYKLMRISDPLVASMVNDGGLGVFLGHDPNSAQWWNQEFSMF